jgi:predicted dehydrogenase
MENDIWLIGTGQMSVDYANVLKALGVPFTVIGRGENNCRIFKEKTGILAISGGVQKYIENKKSKVPKKAIIAVNVEELKNSCIFLVNNHIKEILLEKPGVAYQYEIKELSEAAKENKAIILLAYNRRFYASVLKAEEIIKQDGGVTSFNFEFTEWSHLIRGMNKTEADFHNWFLGNSTHVVDLAFYLGGKPIEIKAFTKGGLNWHPASSVFAGAGISDTGALFSYHANWEAPGRWVLELLTKSHRLIFKPLEKLQVQDIGSILENMVAIDDQLDNNFKPGLYLQTKAFLEGNYTRFCDIQLQREMIEDIYSKMSGYN